MTHRESFSEEFPGWVWEADYSPDGTEFRGSSQRFGACRFAARRTASCCEANRPVSMTCVQWSPDGTRIATGDMRAQVQVWQADSLSSLWQMDLDESEKGDVKFVRWSPDSTRLATVIGAKLQTWDAAKRRQIQMLKGDAEQVSDLRWSPDGTKLASASRKKTTKIWDTETGEELLVLPGGGKCAWSADGSKLAVGNPLVVFDSSSGDPIGEETTFKARSLAWNPTSDELACGVSDGTVVIWILLRARFAPLPDTPEASRQSIGPPTASACCPRGFKISPFARGIFQRQTALNVWAGLTRATAWPGVPMGSDWRTHEAFGAEIEVWDVARHKLDFVYRSPDRLLLGLTWSPQGVRIAFTTNIGVTILDVATRQATLLSEAPTAVANSIAWHKNGRLAIAYRRRVNEVVICDEDGTKLATLKEPHKVAPKFLNWNPDGTRLATTGVGDSHVRVWNVASEAMVWEASPGDEEVTGGDVECGWPDGDDLASRKAHRA